MADNTLGKVVSTVNTGMASYFSVQFEVLVRVKLFDKNYV